jgi:hypothetical protein
VFVPQAQDLLVELATPSSYEGWVRIGVFFLLLMFVWAMPTHYAARLLLDTDERYRRHVAQRRTTFIKDLRKWTPRVLGALTFGAMIGAAIRSQWNLPSVSIDDYGRASVSWHLSFIA